MTRPEGYEDQEHLRRVRGLSCMVLAELVGVEKNILPPAFAPHAGCYGRIEAHHAGTRPGVAMKAPDDTAIPLCTRHHREWHSGSGPFKGWGRNWRRRWAEAAIARVRLLVSGPSGYVQDDIPW